MKKIIVALAIGTFLLPAVSLAATGYAYQFNQNLPYGSSGPEVTLLQEFLNAEGFYNGPNSGNFFTLTKTALINFQKQNGIQPASGFFGSVTRGVVNKLTHPISSAPATSTSTPPASSVSNAAAAVVATTPPPNTTSCNGTNWNACPAGQQFICPTDGIKPYCQVPPPPATAAQIAGIALLCSLATSQGNTQTIQNCADGTILNGYNTNAIFRSNIDSLVQQVQQKQTATAQQQANCEAFVTSYDPTVSSAANLLSTQTSFAEEEACLSGNTAAAQQQAQQQIQQAQTAYQLQQLQSSVNANTAAIQQQKQSTPPQTQTSPTQTNCTTQPWWNAGVLQYTKTCSPSY